MATKVLVFESDPAFAGELRNELGKLGCSTTVVDDGNVGLQQASTDRPDLVLLSIELPRMNGFSVCNKLKKDANLKDVPLIIMSSESSDETFEQHKKLRTRAEDYVHKPIAFGELLQHIQSFVHLGGRAPETDSAIVIDDEIEIGNEYATDDDGTQIAPRPPSDMLGSGTQRGMETVDADVDAFADAAFGRLTNSEPPGPIAATAEARPLHNGSASPESTTMTARRPTAPPMSRNPSVRPPTGVDIAEYEKLREELVRTRGRATALEASAEEARNEIERWRLEASEAERLTRELEELRAKLASGAPKTAGISSREFLDLREALNKKDKEILSLKEAQSRKDKEHVESQDRMLALERAKADLDDKALGLEREAAETRDRLDSLAADKDLAKKAAEDFKGRLEKSRLENEGKERQLAELRAKHGEETASYEAKLAAVRGELDQTLANERADNARALDEAEERRRLDAEQGQRDRVAAAQEAREQSDRERQEALAAQAGQLKQEHDAQLAALHRAQQQELARTRGEAERVAREAQTAHEGELATTRKQGEDEVARVRSEGDAAVARAKEEGVQQAAAVREALLTEHAAKVSDVENDRDARLAALESRAARELSDANDKLAKADMDLSATRGELGELRETKAAGDAANLAAMAEVQARLAETTSARDELDRKYAVATDRIATLEAEQASTRLELGETRQKLAAEATRAARATAKWEADRASLDRAKDAMAVALAQIEEAEGRSLG